MASKRESKALETIVYDPVESISRAEKIRAANSSSEITISGEKFSWSNNQEKVAIIRKGLPYESIEIIGKKGNLPVRQILNYLGIAQTTYNKKKREQDLLTGRDSEVVLMLLEVLDVGLEVFNNEKEKFQRWLKKPNISLGNVAPESLFDSVTGIQEVRKALNRIEYGNMA